MVYLLQLLLFNLSKWSMKLIQWQKVSNVIAFPITILRKQLTTEIHPWKGFHKKVKRLIDSVALQNLSTSLKTRVSWPIMLLLTLYLSQPLSDSRENTQKSLIMPQLGPQWYRFCILYWNGQCPYREGLVEGNFVTNQLPYDHERLGYHVGLIIQYTHRRITRLPYSLWIWEAS